MDRKAIEKDVPGERPVDFVQGAQGNITLPLETANDPEVSDLTEGTPLPIIESDQEAPLTRAKRTDPRNKERAYGADDNPYIKNPI